MNIFNELSKRNSYQPDLTSADEACRRTYGQASEKLAFITTNYQNIDLDKLTPEEIYDICSILSSDLALCCELFLKSIYIYENGLKGTDINAIWDNLAHPKEIYINNNGIVSMLRVDNDGNPILDKNGNKTFIDKNGNVLQNGTQGSKVKKSGHDLEHLITNIISKDSKILLNIMMTTKPTEQTEKYKQVDLVDILTVKGGVEPKKRISDSQYEDWLNQHAMTFVEARYAGQKNPDTDVAFLFHLATQCKSLAQYIIEPERRENIDLTIEEMKNLPEVITQLKNLNRNLVTQDLIKLVINDESKKKNLEKITKKSVIKIFDKIKPRQFYSLIKLFDDEELAFVCYSMILCSTKDKHLDYPLLHMFNSQEILNICLYLKKNTNIKINKDTLEKLLYIYAEKRMEKLNFYNIDTNKKKNF